MNRKTSKLIRKYATIIEGNYRKLKKVYTHSNQCKLPSIQYMKKVVNGDIKVKGNRHAIK